MDSQNYRDLARKAWELSRAAEVVQKILLQMFNDEFITIDEEEFRKNCMSSAEFQF